MSFQSETPLGTEIENGTESAISDANFMPFEVTGTATPKKINWANIKATLKTYFDTIYTTLAAILANNNVWTGSNTFNSTFALGATTNSSLTGANARIPSHTYPNVTFTNASLTSIASAKNGGVTDGHTLILTNGTGSNLTIVNNYGSAASGEAIFTGSASNIVIPTKSSFWLIYNSTAGGWLCVSSGLFKTVNNNSLLGSGNVAVGDMLSANNLSDVSNIFTSRNNLGIYEMFITTGDQTTTSNVAANITGLVTGTLEANKRYYFEGLIHIGCNNTGGVKIQITLPTGATVFLATTGNTTSGTGTAWSSLNASATLLSVSYSTQNTSFGQIRISGEVQMSSTTGTVQFGFASGTNTQTSTIYQLGTVINYKKLN